MLKFSETFLVMNTISVVTLYVCQDIEGKILLDISKLKN